MNTTHYIPLIGIACVVFALLEYAQHRDYNEKHPDYERIPSGIYGYIFLAVACTLITIGGLL